VYIFLYFKFFIRRVHVLKYLKYLKYDSLYIASILGA
jgi:hypothetical protein